MMNLDITDDEALVLLELLSRFTQDNVFVLEDQAEQRALWNLTCAFEKSVPVVFSENYKQLLAEARENIRDEGGTNSTTELENGRVALWLDPKQIDLIISQWRALPDTSSDKELEQWANIAFRCNAALNKAGLKDDE